MPIFNCLNTKLIDGFLFRFTHHICYGELLLVLHFFLVCLYKVFQRTLFFCRFRFIGKAFAKIRRFFQSTNFFRSFFRKNFIRTAEAISRSLVRLQDKILFTVPAGLRMSSLLAFSLESGCKGTHFFRFRKDMREFF